MAQEMTKKELNKKTFIAGIFYVVTQLVVRGISFLTTPIYTRLVSTTQYGEIKVFESWLLIFVPLMSLCLYRSVERAKYDFRDKFDEFVSSVQTLSYISVFICFSIITIFFRDEFMEFCSMNPLMYVFAILYTFCYTGTMYYLRKEKQLLRYKQTTFITAMSMIPATILSILLLYLGNMTGNADKLVDLRVIGFYVPQLISGVIVAFIMYNQGRWKVKIEYWKYALAYSLPLIPEMLSIQVMNQSNKIMIQKLVSDEAAGLFSLGATVSFIIWIVEESVWYAWLPWLYEKISRKEEGDIPKPWMQIVYIFAYISWVLVAMAPEIILVLGGKEYASTVYMVAPLVTGTLFRFFSYIYMAVQNYHKKTAQVAMGTVIAMVINVVLNAILITMFGYQAAAYTTAISYFLQLVIQGLLEKRHMGKNMVPMSKMVSLAVVLFMINMITMLSFDWAWYMRYVMIFVSAVVMLKVMWPMVKQLLKQMKK